MESNVHVRMVVPPAPWTRALEDGSVQVPGLSWECRSDIDFAPARFIASAEAGSDVGENGVRRLILDILNGAPPTGIPVFFGREHMQRNIIVRADGSLTTPRDLAGKRVGSRLTIQSGTGAAVLMMLEAAYGLDLRSVHWYCTSRDLPENRMGLDLHPGPDSDEAALEQVARGELDGVFLTAGPRYWSLFGGDKMDEEVHRHPGLRPLVDDPATIADAYRRTHLYPISDVAVVRADLAQRHPEAPAKVVEACSQANTLAGRHRSPEEQRLAEREIALLGEDPHRYGLGPNQRANLAAFIDLLYRLGAIGRRVEPEEVFVPSTIG